MTPPLNGHRAISFLSDRIATVFQLYNETTPEYPLITAFSDRSVEIRFRSPMHDHLIADFQRFSVVYGPQQVYIPADQFMVFVQTMRIDDNGGNALYRDLFIAPGYSLPAVPAEYLLPVISLRANGTNAHTGEAFFSDDVAHITLVIERDGKHHFSQGRKTVPVSPMYEHASLAAYRQLMGLALAPSGPPLTMPAPLPAAPSISLGYRGPSRNGDKVYTIADSPIRLIIRQNGTGHHFSIDKNQGTGLGADYVAYQPDAQYETDVIKAYQHLVTVEQLRETYRSSAANGGWFAAGRIFGFFSYNSRDEVIQKLQAREHHHGASEYTLKAHTFSQ